MEADYANEDWLCLVDELMADMPDPVCETPGMIKTEDVPTTDFHNANISANTSSASSLSSHALKLTDLKGTTAYASRKMTAEERELMLLKRKLRNRDSARRSKAKRDCQVQSIQVNFVKMLNELEQLKLQIQQLGAENTALKQENNSFRTTFFNVV